MAASFLILTYVIVTLFHIFKNLLSFLYHIYASYKNILLLKDTTANIEIQCSNITYWPSNSLCPNVNLEILVLFRGTF